MDTEIFVPYQNAEAELIEKKSRFIASLYLIESESDAHKCIRETHERFPDARHGVYAYDIKSANITRFSDNGEPKGTAGMPVLDVFRKRGITNFCCIVTRYFGGILLGANGLVRAYSGTAALALDAAGTAKLVPYTRMEILCEYPFYDKVQHLLKNYPIRDSEVTFDLDVTLSILLPKDVSRQLEVAVTECTSGRAILSYSNEMMLPQKTECS